MLLVCDSNEDLLVVYRQRRTFVYADDFVAKRIGWSHGCMGLLGTIFEMRRGLNSVDVSDDA